MTKDGAEGGITIIKETKVSFIDNIKRMGTLGGIYHRVSFVNIQRLYKMCKSVSDLHEFSMMKFSSVMGE